MPLTEHDLAKYPFLPQAKQHVAELGIDIAELGSLEVVLERAKERITATYEFVAYYYQQPSKKLEVEITSFPVAILVVAGVNDNTLRKRYALSEAKKMYNYLISEKNDEIILRIAKFFKWDINPSEQTPYPYTIQFVNYVNNTTRGRLVHASKWKLVNRQILKGQIYVTRQEVCRLLQEEIKKYIEDKAKEKIAKTPQSIQALVDEIKAEFLKRKPHLAEFDQIVLAEESEYPPCIKNLMDRIVKGQHLSHVERLTLVTYLLHQGVSTEGVVNLFSNVADFREDKTRYQVEHLAGQRGSRTIYKPYNCATLQTHGVCVNPNDPICRTIRNPLNYHLRKRPQEAPPSKPTASASTQTKTAKELDTH
jgi:DNA primase large subunit